MRRGRRRPRRGWLPPTCATGLANVATDVRTSVQMGADALAEYTRCQRVRRHWCTGQRCRTGDTGSRQQQYRQQHQFDLDANRAIAYTAFQRADGIGIAAQNASPPRRRSARAGCRWAITSPMGIATQSVMPGAGAAVERDGWRNWRQYAGHANQLAIQPQLQAMSRQQLAQIGVAQALQSIAGLHR